MTIIKIISEWKKKGKGGQKMAMAIVEIDGKRVTRHIKLS
jgi:hypothetical protein